MIIAKTKPLKEITENIDPYQNILVVGCGGCTSVCLAGGHKEVEEFIYTISKHYGDIGRPKKLTAYTIETQCETNFVNELKKLVQQADAIISLGCGAGAQLIAEMYSKIPVFPGLNSTFVGVSKDMGYFEEKCRVCGDCQLAYTGGICPITRCAKSIFNGPCGGTRNEGSCEVDKNTPCAWMDIYERLSAQDRVANIEKVKAPTSWKNQIQGTHIHDNFKKKYSK